jgi:hypothetical protein
MDFSLERPQLPLRVDLDEKPEPVLDGRSFRSVLSGLQGPPH